MFSVLSAVKWMFLSKKEEIIWYISNPHFFHIEDAVPYEDLSSERFDLFNKRLEELNIPAKVTFSVSA